MKNPFLQLLEDPAHLITVEFDNAEKGKSVTLNSPPALPEVHPQYPVKYTRLPTFRYLPL